MIFFNDKKYTSAFDGADRSRQIQTLVRFEHECTGNLISHDKLPATGTRLVAIAATPRVGNSQALCKLIICRFDRHISFATAMLSLVLKLEACRAPPLLNKP